MAVQADLKERTFRKRRLVDSVKAFASKIADCCGIAGRPGVGTSRGPSPFPVESPQTPPTGQRGGTDDQED